MKNKQEHIIRQNDLILRALGQILEKYPNNEIRRIIISDIDKERFASFGADE